MAEPSMEVLQVLVQEAQGEIGNLRAELYSTRRLAEERRWASAVAELLQQVCYGSRG